MPHERSLRVLFLAAEADPFVKVGGLGDVAGSLPLALKDLGHGTPLDIRLVIPYHPAVRQKYPDLPLVAGYSISGLEREIPVEVYYTDQTGIPTYLIDGQPVADSPGVYSPDPRLDGWKYIFFSLAALELPRQLHWRPHILHANDWHTAIAAYAMRLQKTSDPFFQHTHSLLTIHNLPFMGAGTEEAFAAFNLPPSKNPGLPWWAVRVPLPLGLEAADRIVPVSRTYAAEILTPEFGCGLESFLLSRGTAVSGIVNGLDLKAWDPSTDRLIAANYGPETLSERVRNKLDLSKELEFNLDPAVPLLVMIGRMDQQKGVDLALDVLRQGRGQSWQAVILGSGNPQLEEAARQLAKDLPSQVRAAVRFDATLSHHLYASGDLILMPSRYEPCGLAQMIAMRYGCVPLAHATGGLRDTIVDAAASADATGFLFEDSTPDSLNTCLQRALALFQDRPAWQALQVHGMAQDFSWKRSADAYAKIYQSLKEEK